MKFCKRIGQAGLLVGLCLIASASQGQDEHAREIVFGMSTALTGPAADLGVNMQLGVQVAFDEANALGGINGRPLKLLALDDGYEPQRTVVNMRRLIEQDRVLGIIGNVGTPTAIVAIPIANATKTPFLQAYTGAGILRRSPPDRYVVNFRASYADETAAMVEALITQAGLKPDEVAFFTQRDGYGDAGFVGGVDALLEHGLQSQNQIAHGRYERNTLAVERGLAEIMLHRVPPKAIIMVGTYGPCAKFIRLAKSMGYEGLFLNVSFVGSQSLAQALGNTGDGVVITQVVPHPESDFPITVDYRKAMDAYDERRHRYGFGSLEGYVSARILLKALRSEMFAGDRESVIDALENLREFSIGLPSPLSLSPQRHQASESVWPTVLRDGDVIPTQWSNLVGAGDK